MSGHRRLSEQELRALPTPRLLAYWKKWYRAESYVSYDNEDLTEWQMARRKYRQLIRSILNEREHVEA